VTPYRCYRVSAWIRTEDAKPVSLFSIKAFTQDGATFAHLSHPLQRPPPMETGDHGVQQLVRRRIQLNFGVFEGEQGKVW